MCIQRDADVVELESVRALFPCAQRLSRLTVATAGFLSKQIGCGYTLIVLCSIVFYWFIIFILCYGVFSVCHSGMFQHPWPFCCTLWITRCQELEFSLTAMAGNPRMEIFGPWGCVVCVCPFFTWYFIICACFCFYSWRNHRVIPVFSDRRTHTHTNCR